MQNNDKSPLIAHHFNPSWNEQSYVLPSVKLSLLWLLNHRDLGDGAMHRVFHSRRQVLLVMKILSLWKIIIGK